MRSYVVQTLLNDRLLAQHDVYALYEFQIAMNNALSMAQRCGNSVRIREITSLVRKAYSALTSTSAGRQWTCNGGTICTNGNYIGKEVKLASVQFLGMATQVANALARSGGTLTAEDKQFINDTLEIAAEHMVRWASDWDINFLKQASTKTLADVTSSAFNYQFDDKSLWLITIYSEMAGLRQWQREQGLSDSFFVINNDARMKSHLTALLDLFNKRVTVMRSSTGRLGAAMADADMADVDRGYWKLLSFNGYSAYEGSSKPVSCSPTKVQNVAYSTSTRSDNTSWDLSHARRLVNGLDALERDRAALKSVYNLTDAQLPAPGLQKAFAANLINTVWNGNKTQPLFANYMSGNNGWYATEYSSSSCAEGYKPYGITDSFADSGYITWARHYPQIAELGVRLYDMMKSSTEASSSFMTTYYPRLSSAGSSGNKAISQFMFMPTLVGTPNVVGR